LTKLIYKCPALFLFHCAGLSFLMMLCVLVSSTLAQDAPAGKPLPEKQNPIRITADSLITDSQNRTAEFVGHVLATQGDTTITSDRLKVYYKKGIQSGPNSGMNAIVRMVAQGMVKIVLGDTVAHTEHAEYIADERIVVLSGPNSRIVDGNNSISGQKITLYRDDRRIHVAGTQKEPVEAFFYSDENILGAPKKKN
jgi:lipopolysaccharide export system protein LptA